MIDLRSVLTEGGVLLVFLIGVVVSRALGRRWHPSEIFTMYALGLLFEILTAHMWNYHHIFLIFPTRIDNDISILFPFGWAGLIMTATAIAERVWALTDMRNLLGRHLLLAGIWLAIGDLAETTFYNIGM